MPTKYDQDIKAEAGIGEVVSFVGTFSPIDGLLVRGMLPTVTKVTIGSRGKGPAGPGSVREELR